MRHIFFTHSHITSLVVKCTIDELSLSKKDVLILCEKNHYNHLDKTWFDGLDINIYSRGTWSRIWFRGRVGFTLREWAMSLFISKISRFKKYLLYLPHDFRGFSKHLIFHKNCEGYYYIEEGMGSYIPKLFHPYKTPKKSISGVFMPKAWSFRDDNIYNLYPKLLGGICFDSRAFPPVQHKLIIKSFPNTKIGFEEDFEAPYLIFDDMINMKLCTQENLISILIAFLEEYDIRRLNIKFHYRQTKEEKDTIFKVLKRHNIDFYVINNERVMELFFIGRVVSIIGFVSSLLFYHKLFGEGQTISLFKALANREKERDYSNFDHLLKLFSEKKISFYSDK